MNSRTSKTAAMAVILACGAVAILFNFQLVAAPQAGTGADLYKSRCAMCHGADGAGKTPMGQKQGVRDLTSQEVQKQTDAQLTEVINKGKGKMPGYADKLKPEQVKDLATYLRTLKDK
jgi:cytochrome c6